MDEGWEQLLRERAYAIWLREGSPDGHAEQFWLVAEQELLAEGYSRQGREPQQAAAERPVGDDRVDEASDESLPASDPPARTGKSGVGGPTSRS